MKNYVGRSYSLYFSVIPAALATLSEAEGEPRKRDLRVAPTGERKNLLFRLPRRSPGRLWRRRRRVNLSEGGCFRPFVLS